MDDAILILDASVLINFLCVNEVGLLAGYPAKILITEHVVDEVTSHYQEQLSRLNTALGQGVIEVIIVTALPELELIAELSKGQGKRRLGLGECSAIAVAVKRGYALGIDDRAATKAARKLAPSLKIHNTQDVMVSLIKAGAIDVVRADTIKERWETEYRFRLKIVSFRDLL